LFIRIHESVLFVWPADIIEEGVPWDAEVVYERNPRDLRDVLWGTEDAPHSCQHASDHLQAALGSGIEAKDWGSVTVLIIFISTWHQIYNNLCNTWLVNKAVIFKLTTSLLIFLFMTGGGGKFSC